VSLSLLQSAFRAIEQEDDQSVRVGSPDIGLDFHLLVGGDGI
jgi:hypothetical protein